MSSNLIEGSIPPNINRCSKLWVLGLMDNKISGQIPAGLYHLSKLQILDLSHNSLSGSIPPSIGNLSSLTTLNLDTNSLSGLVPINLGNLRHLRLFELSLNNLTGTVPSSLYNLSSLDHFALAANHLWGEIPSDIDIKLPNLLFFNFCLNKFTGQVPKSLHNLTKIETLRISHNFLHGPLPQGIEKLHHIEMYNLGFNRIGIIPESIGNLSNTLTKIYIGGNRIYGSMPSSILFLRNLNLLNLSHNFISGEIPTEIDQMKELLVLSLAGNRISGKIPDSPGNLSKLNKLELFGNELVGRIPTSFGDYQNLNLMDLAYNRLNDSIPQEIFNLSNLNSLLNLSKNFLSGPLPQEVGLLEKLAIIDISDNQLSGSIPDSIGNCKSLENLLLSRNFLSGHIPNTLREIRRLNTLGFSSNQLSGLIPSDLQQLQVLQFLNLSYNDHEGEVPTDGVFSNRSSVHLEGNPKLCFPSACKKGQNHGKGSSVAQIMIPIAGSIAFCLLGILFSVFFYKRRRSKASTSESQVIPIKGQHQMVSYDELRVATEHFDPENLIGSGSFGSVYKGILKQGIVVGIKVIDHGTHGALKSFYAECEALVYEYIENGNLGDWIHGRRHESGEGLNVMERLNVAIDIACAMDYLHHDCQPPVVHCDLKPRNVLLENGMNAKVGDFGLERLMLEKANEGKSTTATYGLKGSLGYIPPGCAIDSPQLRISMRDALHALKDIRDTLTRYALSTSDEIFQASRSTTVTPTADSPAESI
ncbi:PREDICTED: putative receptor-like protein kinase At3g47110 [Nelumbo nucifera]|uniref:non-specific serine/threonine protein kinase n=1 Tax=Nelumbo nucifera TaxID=4432 RepID=A0A1U8QB26_NELNU|nr:PREDICTED: putative receptor-like protein kinase At3g47110 [Nelumbo nucifera]